MTTYTFGGADMDDPYWAVDTDPFADEADEDDEEDAEIWADLRHEAQVRDDMDRWHQEDDDNYADDIRGAMEDY